MGVLPRIALIFSAPVGAVGVGRLLRGRVSNRARVVAAVAYLALPVGVNMIAQGRIDVLVAVAGLPFIIRRLLRPARRARVPRRAVPRPVPFGQRGWRTTRSGQRLVAVMVVALVTAMAPATLVAAALVVVGVTLARAFDRDPEDPVGRPWAVGGRLLVGVAVLLAPLTVDTAIAGRSALSVFGLARGPWSAPDFAQLARGVDGSFSNTWLGWLLPAAALLSICVCRAERRRLATRVATVGALALLVAALDARHWMGAFTPDLDVLLVLYGVCLAALVGLGVSALENDLRQATFGWRQAAAGALVASLVVAAGPFLTSLASGRFDLPATSAAESLSALGPTNGVGFRVLWLADPSVAPLPGWSVAPGLSAATTTGGLPAGTSLFSPPGAGAAAGLLADVRLALGGRTVRLGSLLAASGVSSIVVMNASAPQVAGVQSTPMRPVPAGLLTALTRQTDLSLALTTPSVEVYSDAAFHGLVYQAGNAPAALTGGVGDTETWPTDATIAAALAPAGDFALRVGATAQPRAPSPDGWDAAWTVASAPAGSASRLALDAFPFDGLLAGATLLAWVVAALGFRGLRRVERLVGVTAGARHARSGHD